MKALNIFEVRNFNKFVEQLGGKINIKTYFSTKTNIYIQITNANPVKDKVIFDCLYSRWLQNNLISFYVSYSANEWLKKFENFLNNY